MEHLPDTAEERAVYREAYQQVLVHLDGPGTRVLTPIDGDGGEFWVHASVASAAPVRIDVGEGVYREMDPAAARTWLVRAIAQLAP